MASTISAGTSAGTAIATGTSFTYFQATMTRTA